MSDIAAHRRRIDEIDEQLVALLNARAAEALAIGRLKAEQHLPVSNPGREADVMRHVVSVNRGPLDEEALRAFYACTIRELSRLERVLAHDRSASDAAATAAPFGRVGIVGVGLIGGSLALSARKAWPGVSLVGLEQGANVEALGRSGVVDVVAKGIEDIASCDLIVLATPVPAAIGVVRDLARVTTDALVTDVGSTKREIMKVAADVGLGRFVGGHPMAGTERSGLDSAVAGLFAGRPWLLIDGGAGEEAAAELERFLAGLGASTRWVAAEPHDQAMAYVSHLPQIVAVALMNAAAGGAGLEALQIAGPAFSEMTRTASSPPDMWRDILASNADFVAEALGRFTRCLPHTGGLRDRSWVGGAFADSGQARNEWRRQTS